MMGRRFRGGASALFFLASAAVGAPAPAAWAAQTALAKVVQVGDGDSMTLELSEGARVTVHLLGIVAPGLRGARPGEGRKAVGQPFAEASRKALEELVLLKGVRAFFYGRDLFRRVMAEVFVEGEDVSLHMVRAGLARVDRGSRRAPEPLRQRLDQAEAEARRGRRGLWMFE